MVKRRTLLFGLAAVPIAAGCDADSTRQLAPTIPAGGADLILHNAAILTMNPAAPTASAIAIVGDRIAAIGDERAVMSLRGSRSAVVDLGARTVLPGFNESHGHWIGDRNMAWGAFGPQHPAQPTVRAAIQAALEVGWTSLTEMFVDEARLNELRELDSGTGLGLRVNAYLPVNYLHNHFGFWFGAYQPGHEYSPYLRLAGAKMFVDRAAPGLMYLSQPHSDANPTRINPLGEVYWTQQELSDMVARLHGRGWQIAAHSCGDGAHDLLLNALGRKPGAMRPRMEHLTVLRDDQIQRMNSLGVIASIQLSWLTSDWPVQDELNEIEATLGPGRIGWAGRWRDLIAQGVTATGGTDTPWTGATPMQAVHQAVTRVGLSGRPASDWMLAQRLTVAESLRLLTAGGAYATFQERDKGSLEVGKLADLVVLSANPLVVPVNKIADIEVIVTMVGGRTQFCSSEIGDLPKARCVG